MTMIAMIATPILLIVLARNDLGKERFYSMLGLIAVVMAVILLGVVTGMMVLAYINIRGNATARIEQAKRWTGEVHHYHERVHTIDGRGTLNVAGGDPLMYPDLVRQLLAAQQGGALSVPQLPAGTSYQAQLPAPTTAAPQAQEDDAWTPYSGMSSEW